MKIFTNSFKLLFLISFFFISNNIVFGQSRFNVGVYGGAGLLSGNFPSRSSFSSSIFIEGDPHIFENMNLRLSFLYSTDFNVLLPKTSYRYTPFIKGISLLAMTSQKLDNPFYVEEGIGPVALNDRTFSGLSEWDYGLAFSVLFGLDFRDGDTPGFRLGAGTSYGLTITNTFVKYLSVHLQLQYML